MNNITDFGGTKMKKIIRILLALMLIASSLLTLAAPGLAAAAEDMQTIYFTAPEDWRRVKVYSWGSEGEITSGWPGNSMTRVEKNVYSFRLPADAVNIIFSNNGSNQTRDLKIPAGMNWYDYTTGTWSIYGNTCTHPGHNAEGNCTECGQYLGHSYVNDVCTGCGAVVHKQTVYFTAPDGWNNANFYSWDSEGEITSGWPGNAMTQLEKNLYSCQLPAEAVNIIFNNGSVQTQDLTIPSGKDWYDYTTGTWSTYVNPCDHPGHGTDGNCTECGAYLGHSYSDGRCTECGAKAPASAVPTLTLSYASVSFEAEIRYNLYFTATDLQDVVEMGLLVFNTEKSEATYETADQIVPEYVSDGSTYMAHTAGVAAKKMGDTLYFRIYAKLADGNITYSQMGGYNCKAYAKSILAGSGSEYMKALIVALLNYGAEAQKFFGYDTDNLMNAELTQEHQTFVDPYHEDTMPNPVAVDSNKNGIFANTGYGTRFITASFEGAFSLNYYFDTTYVPDGQVMMYYWTEEAYAAAGKLTADNASGSVVMTHTGTDNRYWACIDGIAAKEMDKTIFVGGTYTSGGVAYSTGVMNYSVGKYCDTIASQVSAEQALAQATAVYGYHAKAYFQDIYVPPVEPPVEEPEKPSVGGTYVIGEDELPFTEDEIYHQIFDANTKLEINLDMSGNELQKLQDDYDRYRNMGSKSPIYRMGNLTITVTTEQGTVSYVIKEVGVRMKGNTSRTDFYNQNEGIYNYIHLKFDFQETFDDEGYYGSDSKVWDSNDARKARKNRTFATLEKLEMRWNKLYDATYLKESYAYEIYRSEGVLAPQCNIGVLDWSGARMGIYTVEEPVDDVFIERYVSEEDAGGDLYKLGWTNEGATFTNTNSIGVEDEDKALFYVYDLKTNKKTSSHEQLINLITTLNSGSLTKEKFASVVDVDNFLHFAAVSYFMGNPDDLRNNYNNCYVYFLKSSGKAVFIPYDFDRCLGINREWNPNGNSMTKDNPYGNGNQQSPLFRYSVDKGGFFTEEYTQVLLEVAENELLTADAFAKRFAIAQSLYADQVNPGRNLKNASGRDFSFDLNRTGSASGGSNMSFKDYMSAKMAAFREYMGQSNPDTPVGTYYIRGDFNGWSNDSAYIMERQEQVLVFTLSFDYKVKFKVYDDSTGAWMGAECISSDTTVAWDTDSHTNVVLEAGTYRIVYNPSNKQITITK